MPSEYEKRLQETSSRLNYIKLRISYLRSRGIDLNSPNGRERFGLNTYTPDQLYALLLKPYEEIAQQLGIEPKNKRPKR